MKTNRQTRRISALRGTWTAMAAIASLAVFPSKASSQTTTPTAETKDYVLFIGGNLEIPQDKAFYPVKRVFKKDLEIEINKTLKRVSIEDVREYKVVREPKLATMSATIKVARSEKTVVGDIRARREALSAGMAVQGAMMDNRTRALGAAVRASTTPNTAAAGAPGTAPAAGGVSPRDQAIYTAEANFSKVALDNDLTNGTYNSKKSVEATEADESDALEVDLEVSSPKPLNGAHIVLVTECRDPQKPDVLLRRISPKLVGNIGPNPVKVSLEQQGFPTGFIIEKERLFLYADGSEIVTNLSDNRMEMTRDQAFRYLLVQYIASHSKDNLAPTPIMGAAPADFRSKVDAAQLSQTVSLSINKNGEVTAIAAETPGAARLSPVIELALKNFRFFPALQNGLPAEGTFKAKLSDLFRNT